MIDLSKEKLYEKLASLEEENRKQQDQIDWLTQANQRQFRKPFDIVPVAYQSLDEKGRIIHVNQRWLDMLGYSSEDEVLGKLFGDFWHEKTKHLFPDVYQGFKDTCWINNAELKLVSKNDTVQDYMLSGVIEQKPDKSFGRTHCIIHNITQLKELERELRETVRTKDRFFSIISHDLKGPMNSLNMLVNLMQEDAYQLDQRHKDVINMLAHTSNSVVELLENLLEWSRAQIGSLKVDLEEFPLRSFAVESIDVINETAAGKQVNIIVDIDPRQQIVADRHILRTVLLNLVSNGVKFCLPGGQIVITASAKPSNQLELKIKDNGIGIPKKHLPKLFSLTTKYSTRGTHNEKGTGLGLILCKEFVEKLNGTIRLESVERVGTTVFVTLPIDS